MPSPEIKILLVLASVSIVYAYVCQIRMTRKASHIADWLQKERPELWSELNVVARNWNGGHPALKLIYRRNIVDLPRFELEYGELRAIEREFFWGLGIAMACFCALFAGFVFLGWHW